MEQQLFKELDPVSREEMIRDHAHSVDTMVYQKPLSEEELDYHYKELGNTHIRQVNAEQELEEIKEQFKERINPLKNKIKEHAKAIKTRSLEMEGDVFAIVNHEEKMTGFYDIEGNLVSSRRSLPEELGTMHVSHEMSGTNG